MRTKRTERLMVSGALAKSGLRLLNMNMEAQCTPSRSSLMTGRWAIRSGTHSVPFGGVADGLTQREVTIGEASPRRAMRPARTGSGISGVTTDDCPTTRAWTNGSVSMKNPVPTIHNLYTGPREEKPTVDTWVVHPMLKIVGLRAERDAVSAHPDGHT